MISNVYEMNENVFTVNFGQFHAFLLNNKTLMNKNCMTYN